MISKSQVKDIRALASARGRAEQGRFLVEGDKLVREWLSHSNDIVLLAATKDWLQLHPLSPRHSALSILEVSDGELERISTQSTPNGALLVVGSPTQPQALPSDEWCIVLDRIQDPGNLGSIIRIADWFGVPHIICSEGCADFFNPKVVAAGMGGHLRVQLHHTALASFFSQYQKPVFAATLQGRAMLETGAEKAAALLIGNESKGVDPALLQFATHQIRIPGKGGAESLNAAVATGILTAHLFAGKS